MKAQILKIAGVKSEKEFYKKYPTEEAFMKKHGHKLPKAFGGIEASSNKSTTGNTTTSYVSNKEAALNMLLNQSGSMLGLTQSLSDKYGRQSKQLDQYKNVADVAAKAAASAPRPEQVKYVRPEDQLVQSVNPLGVQGFGYLQNGGEIQNTYAPNTIYTDLGYEPLTDSNPKQYQDGGLAAKIAGNSNQYMSTAGSLGGGLGSLIGGSDFEQTEEGSLLSSIGGIAGTAIGGPIGGLIGSAAGGLLGGAIGGNKNAAMKRKKQEMNNQIAGLSFAANLKNGPFNAIGKNGISVQEAGYMNPNYNPQVIAKFGDYSMDQLLAPPHDADMLRAGGHLKEYTPPSARAMYTGRDLPYQMEDGGQMAMGGDLQVHRGKAETMSYNPFLPNGGETIMFRGPSHDNGGMPISFGENGVEVEGGEPAIQMQDGGEEENLVVYGNMVIPDYGVEELGDPKAKGKKFKHYVADLSKVEAKQNKMLDRTMSIIERVNGDDPFDQLALNSGQANLIGITMKLKDIADKKMDAAAIQNAILDTAEENGLESDALAKGKIKYAKANDPYAEFGAKLSKAQDGKKIKYDPEFEEFIDQAMMLEQANSSREITLPDGRKIGGIYRGGAYNYGTGSRDNEAYDTLEKAKEFYYKNYWSKVKDLPRGLRTRALQMAINMGDPYGELMVAAGKMSVKDRAATKDQRKDKDITNNKDWKKNKAEIIKQYEKDPDAFLEKLDAEQDRYYDSYIANNPSEIDSDTRKEFFNDYIGLAKNVAKPYAEAFGPQEDYRYSRMFGRRLSNDEKMRRVEEFKKNDPVGYNKRLNDVNREYVAEQRMIEGDVPYPTEFRYTPLDSATATTVSSAPATPTSETTTTPTTMPVNTPAPVAATPVTPALTPIAPVYKTVQEFVQNIPFPERKKMAIAQGIKNFRGTPEQNQKLLSLTGGVQTPDGSIGRLANLYQQAYKTKTPAAIKAFQTEALNTLGKDEIKKITGIKNVGKFVDSKFGKMTDAVGKAIVNKAVQPSTSVATDTGEVQLPPVEETGPIVPNWMPAESKVFTPGMSDVEMKAFRENLAKEQAEKEKQKQDAKYQRWDKATTLANSLIPYMRPSNQMELEPVQLAGEMLALSDNTLDPVYAQTYQPQYTQPTSISLQDQLNANQSDFNAMQRQLGYNPDALAALAAQKYGANSKILGEQFRMNQAERQRAMEANRETANDAQLKNMAIFQDQATKMAQTKSTLKQQKQVALSSIADKIAKNKLENRQLGVAENLYNYRYTPSGVAYNVNPFAQFAPYGSGSGGKGSAGQLAPGKKFSYDENQQIIGTYNSSDKEDAKVRNGSIVKAIKNL